MRGEKEEEGMRVGGGGEEEGRELCYLYNIITNIIFDVLKNSRPLMIHQTY